MRDRTKSNSNRLAKSYSLYSHLASHLANIHSLNDGQFQRTSQLRPLSIYSIRWTPHVILSMSFFLLPTHLGSGRSAGPPPLQPAALPLRRLVALPTPKLAAPLTRARADEKGEQKWRHARPSRTNSAPTRGDSPSKGPTNGTNPIPVLKKKEKRY
jgi:hypothetical protein